MSELRCLRGTTSNPLVFATLDEATLAKLEVARQAYGELTGKRATRSLVIRRALHLLADHLKGVDTPTKGQRELAELLIVR